MKINVKNLKKLKNLLKLKNEGNEGNKRIKMNENEDRRLKIRREINKIVERYWTRSFIKQI